MALGFTVGTKLFILIILINLIHDYLFKKYEWNFSLKQWIKEHIIKFLIGLYLFFLLTFISFILFLTRDAKEVWFDL